jgi:hypothetical protein
VAVTAAAGLAPVPAAAQSCTTNPVTHVVECPKGWQLENPQDPNDDPDDTGGGSVYDDGIDCEYVAADPAGWVQFVGPPPSEDAVLVFMVCYVDGRPIQSVGADTYPTWMVPGQEPPPNPAVIANTLYNSVLARLLPPTIEADPAVGTAAILRTPTFVAVANWQGVQTDQDCLTGGGVTVCVAIEAVPTLTFDPGDGREVVTCEDGGTRFDPNGAAPDVQAAAPGACAHTYRERTGAAGRPESWPGVVSIGWEITWEVVTGPPADGAFDPVTLAEDLPRVVEEVQSVVDDD